MKFENTETFNWEGAFRGLRFPMKSNNKSDSEYCSSFKDCKKCTSLDYCTINCFPIIDFVIGKNDMNLAQRMIKARNPNDKFLRQISISTDITAPRFWWSEFDTYKIGTVADSESTMHTGAKESYTMDDFEVKDDGNNTYNTIDNYVLPVLNELVEKYQKTKDFNCIIQIKQLLPESFLQKRAVTMNYEVVRNIIRQRYNHRLPQWRVDFINWCHTLPYSRELLFYCNGKDEINE